MIELGQMVLKGENRVHNDQIGPNGLEILKGVNRVQYGKIRLNGLGRSQLGTQCKNQVIWS